MNADVERYELCLQCLAEKTLVTADLNNSIWYLIKHRMNKELNWQNPIYRFKKIDVSGLLKLCPNCPYTLEHVVITGKEIPNVL